MSSSRRELLLAALCTPLLATSLRAENRNDSRSTSRNDSDSTYYDKLPPIPRDIGGKTFKEWMKDLDYKDPSVRGTAITILPGFWTDAEPAVPRLVELTHDRDAGVRAKAVLALKVMGIRETDITRVVKALGERISSDQQAIVSYEAALALTRFGPSTRAVVLDLVRGVGDTRTWELRSACIGALIVAGVDKDKGPDDRVIDALILRSKAFIEPTAQVRKQAIFALGAMGRPQSPTKLNQVLAALRDNFHSPNKVIRLWAHISIMALEDKVDKKYLEIIAGFLKDPVADIRLETLRALAALQSKADEFVPNILELLAPRHKEENSVRIAACQALGRIRNRGTRVLRALIGLTEKRAKEDEPVVMAACNALAAFGSADADVANALQAVIDSDYIDKRQKKDLQKAIEDGKKAKKDDTKPRKGSDKPLKGTTTKNK